MNSFQCGMKLFQIRMNSFQIGMNSLYDRYSHTVFTDKVLIFQFSFAFK